MLGKGFLSLLAVSAFLLANHAATAQTFSANSDVTINEAVPGNFFIPYSDSNHQSKNIPVSSDATVNRQAGQGHAQTAAGPGYLQAFAEAHSQLTPLGANSGANSEAQFSLSDVIISSPLNVDRINTSVNLIVGGTFLANSFGSNPAASTSTVEIALYYIEFGQEVYSNGSYEVRDEYGSKSQHGTNALANGLGNIQLDLFNVPTNTPLPEFRLFMRASASTYSGAGDAVTDFYHTLTFNTHGPVFNLPAGYTANSVQGGIINNGYISPLQNPVPEPGSIALLAGIGTVGIGVFQRRNRKSPKA